MPALMATAEYVTKVHAVCTRTGNLAHYSYRKAKSEALVLLGETEEYEPLSRAAFYKAQLRDKVVKLEVKDAENVVENQKSASVEAAEKTGKQA
jgi:thymidine kinase